MEQQKFIDLIKAKAIELQTTYNILASITISQGILESGWNSSILSLNANNLFGIKYTEGCGYDKYLINTKEIINNQEVIIQAYFRKYNSIEDSIKDHAVFLQKERYKNIIGDTSYESVANKLYQDGYSTSPEYPSKLIKLIKQYGLDEYDKVSTTNQVVVDTSTTETIETNNNVKEGSNKMKISIRAGHSDNCTGAIGIVDEHEQMKLYYQAVKTVFEENGHTIIDCNSNGSTASAELSEGATASNNANADLFISLHMNCYNGSAHGVEALVSSTSSGAYTYANNLCTNFSALGLTNRGVKCESLYEMNHVTAPNIIFEICFCDNDEDMAIFNKYSWEQLAHRLCNAIDSNIAIDVDALETTTAQTGYIVTSYLPNGKNGNNEFEGVDADYVMQYFEGIRCYFRGNASGIWIETEYLAMDKCLELKTALGSWFYQIAQ